ncbi:40S ribosomal protein S7 [Ceraceosorus bombacis]|uniref:40S ribosomal protein S7 n=1 Tax=Ceraceosorus bombacis TaxID=401625 RepID=A0A0P1BEN1_9BASI|nr:40S ribosomal protein S7 [Ceraceosorus bombacis]
MRDPGLGDADVASSVAASRFLLGVKDQRLRTLGEGEDVTLVPAEGDGESVGVPVLPLALPLERLLDLRQEGIADDIGVGRRRVIKNKERDVLGQSLRAAKSAQRRDERWEQRTFEAENGDENTALSQYSASSHPQILPNMASVSNKILRTAGAPAVSPSETETTVAQALLDLESNVPELKAELRPLQISAAKEVDVKGGKKAIVIFVPVPQLKAFHKIQQSILEDLVFPTEITGKRVRVATDGNKLIKCFLDSKDATSLEYKLDSFSSVYRKLTGKEVTFMFKDADGV